jgi:hypothetical protein
MLELLFERRHRVMLARFFDRMTAEDLQRLDAEGRAFADREGAVRGIVDFTDVSVVDVSTSVIANLGRMQPMMGRQAERIFVVPQPELFGLGRLYATYQRHGGNNEPVLVATMTEAYAAYDLRDPDFQPLP